MRLLHTTPRKNLNSISERGILVEFHQCHSPAIWLHAPANSAYAVRCVCRRHGCTEVDLVDLVVSVPRKWITRYSCGVWRCWQDVPLAHILDWRSA